MIHNLGDISFEEKEVPFSWAIKADLWLKEKIQNVCVDKLIEYEKYLPNYERAIPTNEHYLPFLYILGMRGEKAPIKTIYEEIQNGSISMRSIEVEI